MNLGLTLITFSLTLLTLYGLRPVADKIGLIDSPGGRKTHLLPTPMIGGIGIYIGILSVLIITPALMQEYGDMAFLSGLVLAIGIIDDQRELSARSRLLWQSLAGLGMALLAGVRLESLGDILGSGPTTLGLFAIPFTVFATVGVINAVNMSDGLDGLSGGLVTIALAFLAFSALIANEQSSLLIIQILLAAILAFLALNFRPFWQKHALIYLGDSGSTLLGFILAWFLIASSQGSSAFINPVTALWFVAVPLIDTVSLLIRRPLRGDSPFKAGRDHLHHRILAKGFTAQQTVLILLSANLLFAIVGFTGFIYQVSEALMFTLFMFTFSCYFILTKDEVLAGDANINTKENQLTRLNYSVKQAKLNHIAVIMDGNNRWAKANNVDSKRGHRHGAAACKGLILDCIERNIPYLTLFAFSTENWLRSEKEIRTLMVLFRSIIIYDEISDLDRAGAKIQFIGNRENFSKQLQKGMQKIEQRTASNSQITVTVALDYGGHWDIAQSFIHLIKNLDKDTRDITPKVSQVQEYIRSNLSTAGLPDPDLCIRTGGEKRISNFLLWQISYTELYFCDTFWPAFNAVDLDRAIDDYCSRQRRYGKTA